MTIDFGKGTNDEGRMTNDKGRMTNSPQTPKGEYLEE